MQVPASLTRSISPPPTRHSAQTPTPAAVEAGQARLFDPIAYFHDHLKTVSRETEPGVPRLDLEEWKQLWQRNQSAGGRMFVVHQHDHPIAGLHYDLRLQFSSTSSISFSIPYGLPGDPNSIKMNRMAIETRVHCLWNHLQESASHVSGSQLIWDTGEYEVLPYKPSEGGPETDDDLSDPGGVIEDSIQMNNNEMLFESFQNRHIRLRLHGTKLPRGYTIAMRLPSSNNKRTGHPKRKRRRKDPNANSTTAESSDSESRTADNTPHPVEKALSEASDDGSENELIRTNNAYPGSENTIGSVHQRQWFLSLDKPNSGFPRLKSGTQKGRWVPNRDLENGTERSAKGWIPFHVRGRDVERSVITGRSAAEIMRDEGVEGYVGRKQWRPILQ